MKKGIHITLIVCGVLAILDVVCVGVGWALGGSLSFSIDPTTRAVTTTETRFVRGTRTPDPFTVLEIDVSTADITVAPGDDWALEYALAAEPEITATDGCLRLTAHEKHSESVFGFSFGGGTAPLVKVTVPRDADLTRVTLRTDVGDVVLSDLTPVYTEIGATTGDVFLHGVESEIVTVECNTGDVHLETLTARTLDVMGNTGDLSLLNVAAADRLALSTNTGDIIGEKIAASASVSLDTNVGDVACAFACGASEFAMQLKAGLGDVTVNGIEHGGSYTSQGVAPLHAETNTGDVDVWFL